MGLLHEHIQQLFSFRNIHLYVNTYNQCSFKQRYLKSWSNNNSIEMHCMRCSHKYHEGRLFFLCPYVSKQLISIWFNLSNLNSTLNNKPKLDTLWQSSANRLSQKGKRDLCIGTIPDSVIGQTLHEIWFVRSLSWLLYKTCRDQLSSKAVKIFGRKIILFSCYLLLFIYLTMRWV